MTSLQHRSNQLKRENIIEGLEAKIEVNLEEDLARIAYLALKPDLDKAPKSSFMINISHDEDRLVINLRGDDMSQLRALINSYLRLINVILNTIEYLKE
ncbi:MAG: CTAG/PCC1 family protein [archaeon]|nr:CTAG/PCC1 family protein [archaeon]MCP8320898.1 CTAG/PCC1 family protein [archaeon]